VATKAALARSSKGRSSSSSGGSGSSYNQLLLYLPVVVANINSQEEPWAQTATVS